MTDKPKIPVILGPTTVGKTSVGMLICEALNGEIISADSRQIYRGMTIGTAKPSPAELARCPHHLVDILEPGEVFSAGLFIRRAMEAVHDIVSRKKTPVVVGGAGLYIKALTEGIFEGDSSDPEVRSQLEIEFDQGGAEPMLARLKKIDPEYAKIVHRNDRKKLVRALEIFRVSGMTITELGEQQGDGSVEGIMCGLEMPREMLYDRINRRVEGMIEGGLIKEVKDLLERGFNLEDNSMNSPGYKEAFEYLQGNINLWEMTELIKRNTRRYAKRQMTWFGRTRGVRWFDCAAGAETTAKAVMEYLRLLN